MTSDVVVVGAGPAGAATALLMARAGFRVVLLDRASFPRPKPCGDCLSLGATDVLRRLGLLDLVEALPATRLRGWRIVGPDGSSFAAGFSRNGGDVEGAFAVERRLLDEVILNAAIDAGVTFVSDTRVDGIINTGGRVTGVVAGGRTFSAPLTVGADGLRSIVATRLATVRRPPRLRKVSQTMHIETDAAAGALGEMHVGNGVCVGFAPVSRDSRRCNLTVVADSDRYGRHLASDSIGFIRCAIQQMPALRGRIRPDELDGTELLASGPFDRPVRSVVFDGAALAGDAAGYYDPFTGQGIYQALACAEALATTAAAALHTGSVSAASLRPYAAAHARMLRGPRTIQRIIEHVLARPGLASRAIRRIGRAPPAARALLDVTGDVAPISRLLKPLVLYSLVSQHRRNDHDDAR